MKTRILKSLLKKARENYPKLTYAVISSFDEEMKYKKYKKYLLCTYLLTLSFFDNVLSRHESQVREQMSGPEIS